MSIAFRNTLTVFMIVFLAFTSFANDNVSGLKGVGEDLLRLVGIVIGLLLSMALLVVSLVIYMLKKKNHFAVLVYLSLGALLAIYGSIYSRFKAAHESSLYQHYSNSVADQDRLNSQYWVFTIIGSLLLIGIVLFIIYHLK